jgi:tetratricopeptide (TPR) repeat protein
VSALRISIALLLGAIAMPPSPALRAQSRSDDYTRIVRLYQSGQGAPAVEDLSRWPRGDIDNVFRAAAVALSGDEKIAAAMLHTELANVIIVAQPAGAEFHVRTAGKWLDAANADLATRGRAQLFARRWRYFIVSMFTSVGQLNPAAYYLHLGEEAFANDPMMHVAAGTIAEVRGQGSNDLRRDSAIRINRSRVAEGQMQAAVNQYLKALSLDRHLALAHLHVGWVRQFLHDDERARPELEAALADADNDTVRYLAHLFLGAVDEHVNQLAAAKDDYEAAIAVSPRYQTGYVGLSRIEESLGHHERAQELALLCAQIAKGDDDPWWDFRVRFDRDALHALRRQAMRR